LLQPTSINRLRIVSMEARRFPWIGAEFYKNGPERVNLLLASYLEDRQRAGELKPMDASLAAEQFVEMSNT
jgi:TetR/AcrR family transcriptional repressor of mexJK operon